VALDADGLSLGGQLAGPVVVPERPVVGGQVDQHQGALLGPGRPKPVQGVPSAGRAVRGSRSRVAQAPT
jgi:hypothetical protein